MKNKRIAAAIAALTVAATATAVPAGAYTYNRATGVVTTSGIAIADLDALSTAVDNAYDAYTNAQGEYEAAKVTSDADKTAYDEAVADVATKKTAMDEAKELMDARKAQYDTLTDEQKADATNATVVAYNEATTAYTNATDAWNTAVEDRTAAKATWDASQAITDGKKATMDAAKTAYDDAVEAYQDAASGTGSYTVEPDFTVTDGTIGNLPVGEYAPKDLISNSTLAVPSMSKGTKDYEINLSPYINKALTDKLASLNLKEDKDYKIVWAAANIGADGYEQATPTNTIVNAKTGTAVGTVSFTDQGSKAKLYFSADKGILNESTTFKVRFFICGTEIDKNNDSVISNSEALFPEDIDEYAPVGYYFTDVITATVGAITDELQSNGSQSFNITTRYFNETITPINLKDAVTGGTAPYKYSIADSSRLDRGNNVAGDEFLPNGITLSSDGKITGSIQPATAAGNDVPAGYFNVVVTDKNGATKTIKVSFLETTFKPLEATKTLTIAGSKTGTAIKQCDVASAIEGGSGSYTYELSDLPVGADLKISGMGFITGSFTKAAASGTFYVEVNDALTSNPDFKGRINPIRVPVQYGAVTDNGSSEGEVPNGLTLSSAAKNLTMSLAKIGDTYTLNLATLVSGGSGSYTYELKDVAVATKSAIQLDLTTAGVFTAKALKTIPAGFVDVLVKDAKDTNKTATIRINYKAIIDPTAYSAFTVTGTIPHINKGVVGDSWSINLRANVTGGSGTVKWALAQGNAAVSALGATINQSGVLSGTMQSEITNTGFITVEAWDTVTSEYLSINVPYDTVTKADVQGTTATNPIKNAILADNIKALATGATSSVVTVYVSDPSNIQINKDAIQAIGTSAKDFVFTSTDGKFTATIKATDAAKAGANIKINNLGVKYTWVTGTSKLGAVEVPRNSVIIEPVFKGEFGLPVTFGIATQNFEGVAGSTSLDQIKNYLSKAKLYYVPDADYPEELGSASLTYNDVSVNTTLTHSSGYVITTEEMAAPVGATAKEAFAKNKVIDDVDIKGIMALNGTMSIYADAGSITLTPYALSELASSTAKSIVLYGVNSRTGEVEYSYTFTPSDVKTERNRKDNYDFTGETTYEDKDTTYTIANDTLVDVEAGALRFDLATKEALPLTKYTVTVYATANSDWAKDFKKASDAKTWLRDAKVWGIDYDATVLEDIATRNTNNKYDDTGDTVVGYVSFTAGKSLSYAVTPYKFEVEDEDDIVLEDDDDEKIDTDDDTIVDDTIDDTTDDDKKPDTNIEDMFEDGDDDVEVISGVVTGNDNNTNPHTGVGIAAMALGGTILTGGGIGVFRKQKKTGKTRASKYIKK